jgi:hypothetical protein
MSSTTTETLAAAIIDPVPDYDAAAGRSSTNLKRGSYRPFPAAVMKSAMVWATFGSIFKFGSV